MNDLGGIISYNASVVSSAGATYDLTRLNSNSFVNTVLGSVDLSVPNTGGFFSFGRADNGQVYRTPAGYSTIPAVGLINVELDSQHNVDHGFHQLGANPFIPQTSAPSPVQSGADPGNPSDNPPNGPAGTGAPGPGAAPPADNPNAPGPSPNPGTGPQSSPAIDGTNPDNPSVGFGGFGFQGGGTGYRGFTGYNDVTGNGGYPSGLQPASMNQEQDPSQAPTPNTSPASTAAPAPGPVSSPPTDDPGHMNGDLHDHAPGPGYSMSDNSGTTASGDKAANQGTDGYNGGRSMYGGYDGETRGPSDPDPDAAGAGVPIVLDLSGQGINVTQLTSSNQSYWVFPPHVSEKNGILRRA